MRSSGKYSGCFFGALAGTFTGGKGSRRGSSPGPAKDEGVIEKGRTWKGLLGRDSEPRKEEEAGGSGADGEGRGAAGGDGRRRAGEAWLQVFDEVPVAPAPLERLHEIHEPAGTVPA